MHNNLKQQEVHFTTDLKDNDAEMWVPPDSDSESVEMEGLGPEFEEDKKDLEECNTEDTYSFNVWKVEDSMLEGIYSFMIPFKC